MGSHRAAAAPASRPQVEQDNCSLTPYRRRFRAAGRFGVLSALVAATVVVPVSQQALADGGVLTQLASSGTMPSTVSALASLSSSAQVPASLAAAGPVVDRDTDTASRTLDRDTVLPGCSGLTPTTLSANGQLPASDLCTLWDGHTQARADYAVALAQLNQAFVIQFGADLCLSSGYRTLAQQRAVKAQKGGLAATPGKSNHGLGLAVDFCTSETTGARWTWLNANGPTYGIENPDWAKPGGSGPHERWHWEFTAAVAEDNSYTGATAGDG
ncbi:MAG: M15 family metallopeptidase [Cellulomonas sp.]|nr:M15 family metallopeptidase [Cellulomonas sp.]